MHEAKPDRDAATPDLAGALMFAAAVGLLALGLVKSPEWGWGSARTFASLAGAVVLAAIFVWQSRRHVSPVIDPALLRVRTFRWANAAMLIFNVAFAANLLVGILWMQQVWGWSALTTGFAVAVGPVFVPITAALTHRLLPGVTPARLVAIGSLLCAVGAALMAVRMGVEPNYLTGYLPGWILGGVGVGFALPNLMAGATHDLPPAQSATGSAIVTMSRQIGFVIGVSLLFAIVGDQQGIAATDGFVLTWWVAAGSLVVAAVSALGMAPRPALVEGAALAT